MVESKDSLLDGGSDARCRGTRRVRSLARETVGTSTRGTGEDYERNLWEGQGSGKGRGAKEGTAAWPGEPCGREGLWARGRVGEGAKLEMRDGARTGDYPELDGQGSRGCQRMGYGVGPVAREIKLAQGRVRPDYEMGDTD